MNTKRIAKWGVVLFLLAALPGLTAVMAQGPEPAAMEKGETAAIVPWSNTESKPNNTRANAEPPDFVQGGNLSSNVDIDFFYVPTFVHEAMKTNTPILIDVEAASMSSPMQVLIKLWAQDGTLLDTAEYTAGRDPLLYYNIDGWNADYFLSVQAAAGNAGYGPNYKYQLLFSYPLLISAAAAGLGTGTVDGIPFKSGDVLAWSRYWLDGVTYEKWYMLLDLSDLGLNVGLTNVAGAWRNSDFLLVGLAGNTSLPGGAGTVKAHDVVLFDPSRVGADTAGTLQPWWAGAHHGLTTTGEALDAIDWPEWNGATRLYASTTGAASVPAGGAALKLADEDIGLWSESDESWTMFIDNSAITGLAAEDVIAFSATYYGMMDWQGADWSYIWRYNMVIAGTARCGPAPQALITQKDIFRHEFEIDWFNDEDFSSYYNDQCRLIWHGPDHGWNYNIDAIDFYFGEQ